MTNQDTPNEPKRRGSPPGKSKPRSPSYPGIDLEQSIGLATKIWNQEHRNEAAEETILRHWEYKPKSGPGLVTIAALKAFGLLEVNKENGKLKLSELALRIILDTREGSPEKEQAVREAALSPSMHKLMWTKYKSDLPSEENIRYFLLKEKEFTELGAKQFIAQYRKTLSYANLGSNVNMSDAGKDELTQEEPIKVPPSRSPETKWPVSTQASVREVPIPISGTVWPSIKAAFPMSSEAWSQMILVLEAMKPGLVSEKHEDDDGEKT